MLCFQKHDWLLQALRHVPAQSPFSGPQRLPCSAGQKNSTTAFSSQPCLAIIGCCAHSLIKTDTWPWMTMCALVTALLGKMPSVLQVPSQHHITRLPTPGTQPLRLDPPRLQRAKAVNYPGPLYPHLMLRSRAIHHIREKPESKPR